MMTDAAYVELGMRAELFANALRAAVGAHLPVQVPNVGSLVGIFMGAQVVTNYDEAKAVNTNGLYAPYFHAVLRRGVAMAPGAYEAMFASLAHTDDDLRRAAELSGEAAAEVARSHRHLLDK